LIHSRVAVETIAEPGAKKAGSLIYKPSNRAAAVESNDPNVTAAELDIHSFWNWRKRNDAQ
jgi:hypothetical protein